MERQFPKNVKQIGNVSDSPKIYVEDYVDTFLNQLCDNPEEEARGAFLIGEQVTIDSQPCVYISGAVRIPEIPMDGTSIQVSEELVQNIREEKETYFKEGEILGWFLTLPGQKAELNENIRKIHEKTFPKTNTVFIIRDTVAKEEMFFAYKYHDLLEIGGHYIYYEKNPAMQNYMVSTHKKNGVTPSEVVTDRAAKDFRSLVRDKMEKQEKKKGGRLSYAASTALVIIAIVIGVSLINNYDKMKTVQKSLAVLSSAVNEKEDPVKDDPGKEGTPDTGQAEPSPDAAAPDAAQGQNNEGEDPNAGTPDPASEAPDPNAENLGEGDAGEPDGGQPEEPEPAAQTAGNVEGVLPETDFYIVQKGDTLAGISKKLYGDSSHVEAICKMNGLEDGNLIFIGEKLLLP